MNHVSGNNRTALRFRSIDGTAFWIADDSLSEYLLHPVFLRYLAIVMLVYALLDQRPELAALGGWGLALLWACVGCVVLVWLTLASPVVSNLFQRGLIRQVYTPALLLPMVICAELALVAMAFVLGSPLRSMTHVLQHTARDLLVVGLLDLLHSNYVVGVHPFARTARTPALPPPQIKTHADPAPVTQHEETVPTPDPHGQPAESRLVQIGPAAIPLGAILLIRTEDHYLGVTTRTGKALHRAKMADIAELHSGTVGMQVNRSVWIAYAAVIEIVEGESRQVVVKLVTGDEERVSRPRVYAFRQSYAKYLAERAGQD